jgi:hypothetical protein
MLKSDKGFTLAHPLIMLYLSRTNTNVKRWRSLLISRKCVARGNGVQDTLREFVVAGLISTGMDADYLSGFVDATEMRSIASAVENYILGYDDGKAIMRALVFH